MINTAHLTSKITAKIYLSAVSEQHALTWMGKRAASLTRKGLTLKALLRAAAWYTAPMAAASSALMFFPSSSLWGKIYTITHRYYQHNQTAGTQLTFPILSKRESCEINQFIHMFESESCSNESSMTLTSPQLWAALPELWGRGWRHRLKSPAQFHPVGTKRKSQFCSSTTDIHSFKAVPDIIKR